jgi:hypothetical protein
MQAEFQGNRQWEHGTSAPLHIDGPRSPSPGAPTTSCQESAAVVCLRSSVVEHVRHQVESFKSAMPAYPESAFKVRLMIRLMLDATPLWAQGTLCGHAHGSDEKARKPGASGARLHSLVTLRALHPVT